MLRQLEETKRFRRREWIMAKIIVSEVKRQREVGKVGKKY